jgi:hypothetical protein
VLHINSVLNANVINQLPRWYGGRWLYPQSHFLKAVLEELFTENDIDAVRYRTLCDDVEYRTGLVQFLTSAPGALRANSGEFVIEERWRADERPESENRFREDYGRGGGAAWSPFLASDTLDVVLDQYRELLANYIQYR